MEHKIKVDEKDHALDGQNKMNSFRKEKKHCDFIITVESEEISVHRAVICSRSDYFDAMFSHDTKEKRTGVAEIKGVDRECTVKCVDFMYTGETAIEEDKCGELMHVATLFQLLTLCNAIAAFLEEKLDCKSFFATRHIADLYSCQKLVDAYNDFALKNFEELVKLEEFKKLDHDYIEFLMTSDKLKASEGVKCKSIIEWVKHNPSSRETYLLGWVKKLELTKIPLTYRRYIAENEPLVRSSAECMMVLMTSVFDNGNVKSKNMEVKSQQDLAVFDCGLKELQVFDVADGTWTTKQAFNSDMSSQEFSAIVVDKYLYVLLNNKAVYRIVHSDPVAVWEKRANKALAFGPAVVLNGSIYTTDYNSFSNQVERYDPAENRWYMLPDRQMNVDCVALATSEEKIFSIGGYTALNRPCNEVEIYDPSNSTWKYGKRLNMARYSHSATTDDDFIYVLGGYTTKKSSILAGSILADVEYRCPRSGTWTILTPMKSARYGFSSCCLNERIYVVGGDGSNSIEEYDHETREWNIIAKMKAKIIMNIATVALPH